MTPPSTDEIRAAYNALLIQYGLEMRRDPPCEDIAGMCGQITGALAWVLGIDNNGRAAFLNVMHEVRREHRSSAEMN